MVVLLSLSLANVGLVCPQRQVSLANGWYGRTAFRHGSACLERGTSSDRFRASGSAGPGPTQQALEIFLQSLRG